MKKILFFFVALWCSAEVINAQLNVVATLQHGDAITQYYGSGALNQAYNASENGDVITLSPGTFTFSGKNFTKGITLRGAGIDAEERTCISTGVNFYSADERLVANIEGIWFNSDVGIINQGEETSHGKINFIKNGFSNVSFNYASPIPTTEGPSVRFYDSIIFNNFTVGRDSQPDFVLYHCYVKYSSSSLTTTTTSSFVNCVINMSNPICNYLNFYNCIFNFTYYNSYSMQSTSTCYNCLCIKNTYGSNLFNLVVSGANNQYVNSPAEIFKTYSKDYTKGETFELTDQAKETYIGTDGTQIGMHGGAYPFTTTVQYPIITKFVSSPQTTKEGKLDIDIQVDGK